MRLLFISLFILPLTLLANSSNILSMVGCFDVTYQFSEIETAPGTKSSSNYSTKARELIVLDKQTDDEIHLQHILMSNKSIIKHWRQEWYNSAKYNSAMIHTLPFQWEMKNFEPNANVWIQYVSNTDDAPRYSCAAKWENNHWKCEAYAPLPRREYTQRNDYNIMLRGNDVEITDKGWKHSQKNKKIMVNSNKEFALLGTEIGENNYTKVADSECSNALKWWNLRKIYWNEVQSMWRMIFSHHNPLKIDIFKDGDPLGYKLDGIVEENMTNPNVDEALAKVKKQSHDIIHTYFLE